MPSRVRLGRRTEVPLVELAMLWDCAASNTLIRGTSLNLFKSTVIVGKLETLVEGLAADSF